MYTSLKVNYQMSFFNILRFPKYLIHLHSNKKSSTHYYYDTSTFFKQKSLNDFQVQNIVKSIACTEGFNNYNKIDQLLQFRKQPVIINDRSHVKESYRKRFEIKQLNSHVTYSETNFYKIHKNEANNLERSHTSLSEENNDIINSIFETSPPTGFKRPHTGTVLKPILRKSNKFDCPINEEQFKKDVYLEAISQDQSAGRIFMKYLLSTNKTVNIQIILKK